MEFLKGLIGGGPRRPGAPVSSPVTLHIYDLGSKLSGVNVLAKAIGTGAFHAGVEIYGREWSYGGTDGGTGVFHNPPRGCTAHSYRESIAMGFTSMTKQEVDKLILELAKEWQGPSYDLLRHNCCHFSDALCIRLGVGPVPSWVTSLAGVGAMLRSQARMAVGGVAAAPNYAAQGVAAAAGGVAAAAQGIVGFAGRMVAPDPSAPRRSATSGLEDTNLRGDAFDPMRVQVPDNLRDASSQGVYPVQKVHTQDALGGGYPGGYSAKGSPSTSASSAVDGEGRPLAVGDLVKVYSNSQKIWCDGQVTSIEAAAAQPHVKVSFWVPNAGSPTATGELATKMVLIGSKDILRQDTEEKSPGSRSGSELSVGDWVEVFSKSNNAWCLGKVTQVSPKSVRVVYQPPGAEVEAWLEKEIENGSKDLRRPKPEAFAEDSPKGGSALTWGREEEAAYRKEFEKLAGPSGFVAPDPMADLLKGSGLPKKVLREIWRASVTDPSKVPFSDFACCCRLVAHCQEAVHQKDLPAMEVMGQAGEQLRVRLKEKALGERPPRLPDFHLEPY
eukprot:TRINITY_DN50846_c0_g1_i1.p1 TRINITY_DN50846_c0_g1~~TRINITY_DN50846_c0_g1_i1.p1  ORF type:complete len:565 (+),score=100.96 TRINITY_DN50846_c0_g1_i1:29-1696(+)